MIIGPEHGPALPRQISAMPEKLRLYAADTYFRESWEDLHTVCEDPVAMLDDVAMITFKPDAFAARKVTEAMEWLVCEGFTVRAVEVVQFDRAMIRATWFYQWNVASRDRKDVVDVLLSSGPSLVVLLSVGGHRPASSYLSSIKGPAVPSRRSAGQLRTALATPNTLLNFVHTADEPADVVRELGVYFPAPVRRRLYREVISGVDRRQRACESIGRIESEIPAHHLDLARTLAEVDSQLETTGVSDNELSGLLGAIRTGASRDWRAVLEGVARWIRLDTWSRNVIATSLVQMDTPDGVVLIPGISSGGSGREHDVEAAAQATSR